MDEETKKQRESSIKVLRITAKISFFFGVILAAFGVSFLRTAMASSGWPAVEGTVTNTRVITQHNTTGQTGRQRHVDYNFAVEYRYYVNGTVYHGERYSLGSGSTAGKSSSDRQTVVDDAARLYPIGSKIPVHYDEKNPTEAVLSTGANMGSYAPLIFGILLLLAAYGSKKLADGTAKHMRAQLVSGNSVGELTATP